MESARTAGNVEMNAAWQPNMESSYCSCLILHRFQTHTVEGVAERLLLSRNMGLGTWAKIHKNHLRNAGSLISSFWITYSGALSVLIERPRPPCKLGYLCIQERFGLSVFANSLHGRNLEWQHLHINSRHRSPRWFRSFVHPYYFISRRLWIAHER